MWRGAHALPAHTWCGGVLMPYLPTHGVGVCSCSTCPHMVWRCAHLKESGMCTVLIFSLQRISTCTSRDASWRTRLQCDRMPDREHCTYLNCRFFFDGIISLVYAYPALQTVHISLETTAADTAALHLIELSLSSNVLDLPRGPLSTHLLIHTLLISCFHTSHL